MYDKAVTEAQFHRLTMGMIFAIVPEADTERWVSESGFPRSEWVDTLVDIHELEEVW